MFGQIYLWLESWCVCNVNSCATYVFASGLDHSGPNAWRAFHFKPPCICEAERALEKEHAIMEALQRCRRTIGGGKRILCHRVAFNSSKHAAKMEPRGRAITRGSGGPQ